MLAILHKEFKSYFTSPVAYVFFIVFLFMFGLYFTILNVFSQNGDYSLVIGSLSNVLIFTIPMLTMRLLSEERKNKTDQLLMTSPITVSDIVLGKYLSALALFALTLSITMIHPLMLSILGKIPLGKIFGAYLGYLLLGTALIAIGLFVSSLCENQIVSAIATIGLFMALLLIDSIAYVIPKQRMASLTFAIVLVGLICLLLYLLMKNMLIALSVGIAGIVSVIGLFFINGEWFDALPMKILQWFSLFNRFQDFTRGLLDIASVLYYVSFVVIFISLTIQIIQKRSWS